MYYYYYYYVSLYLEWVFWCSNVLQMLLDWCDSIIDCQFQSILNIKHNFKARNNLYLKIYIWLARNLDALKLGPTETKTLVCKNNSQRWLEDKFNQLKLKANHSIRFHWFWKWKDNWIFLCVSGSLCQKFNMLKYCLHYYSL